MCCNGSWIILKQGLAMLNSISSQPLLLSAFRSKNVFLSLLAVKGSNITVSTFFIASKDLKVLGILAAKSGRMVVKKLLTLFANWLWSVVVLVSAGL